MLTQMIQRFKKIWHGQVLVQLARLHADPVINTDLPRSRPPGTKPGGLEY